MLDRCDERDKKSSMEYNHSSLMSLEHNLQTILKLAWLTVSPY
jgi:hypothetical protein